MIEYTLLVVFSAILTYFLDQHVLKTNVINFSTRFWKTTGVFLVFQLVFDNAFTYAGIWSFNPNEILGIFVPFIPIENLLYGQVLLWATISLYAYFSSRAK